MAVDRSLMSVLCRNLSLYAGEGYDIVAVLLPYMYPADEHSVLLHTRPILTLSKQTLSSTVIPP